MNTEMNWVLEAEETLPGPTAAVEGRVEVAFDFNLAFGSQEERVTWLEAHPELAARADALPTSVCLAAPYRAWHLAGCNVSALGQVTPPEHVMARLREMIYELIREGIPYGIPYGGFERDRRFAALLTELAQVEERKRAETDAAYAEELTRLGTMDPHQLLERDEDGCWHVRQGVTSRGVAWKDANPQLAELICLAEDLAAEQNQAELEAEAKMRRVRLELIEEWMSRRADPQVQAMWERGFMPIDRATARVRDELFEPLVYPKFSPMEEKDHPCVRHAVHAGVGSGVGSGVEAAEGEQERRPRVRVRWSTRQASDLTAEQMERLEEIERKARALTVGDITVTVQALVHVGECGVCFRRIQQNTAKVTIFKRGVPFSREYALG